MNWQVGERIKDRLEVHKILRGGMGIVYVVYDHQRHEIIAAKSFDDQVFLQNPQIHEMFMQEALLWINLDVHENVTKALFTEYLEGKLFLLMEYVNGGDLSHWVGTPRLTEDLQQVLSFCMQFCDGMNHALSKGILAHRDIKPQNCLITENRILKVSDFGLARVSTLSDKKGGRTKGGTFEYMAPEQWEDFENVGLSADIYSFGAMAYEMLTGTPPFGSRPSVSPQELERRHREHPPKTLAGVPSSLQSLLDRCLAKEPNNRFGSFWEIRIQLAEIYKTFTGRNAPSPVTGSALDARAWNNKGLSLMNFGRHEDALVCLEHATELDPHVGSAWGNMGVVLRMLERHEEELRCYEHALALESSDLTTLRNQAMTLMGLGRVIEALASYDQALEVDPTDAESWVGRAKMLLTLGRRDEAFDSLDRATKLGAKSEFSWNSMGESLRDLHRYDEALQCYDRAITFNPTYAPAWSNKGLVLGEILGRWNDALICYEKALELEPRLEETWYNLANAQYALGNNSKAVDSFEYALKLNPRDKEAWFNKGVILTNALQRHREALACFQEAEKLGHPRAGDGIRLCRQKMTELTKTTPRSEGLDAISWFSRGDESSRFHRHADAIAFYDQALKLDPNLKEAWINKGLALEVLGKTDEALACFEHSIEIAPQYLAGWANKGTALGTLERHEESLACFERALEIDPTSEIAWMNKGVALGKLSRSEEAIASYDSAIRINPQFKEAWFNKGKRLIDLGRFYDAIECLEKARRLGHPHAAEWIGWCRRRS